MLLKYRVAIIWSGSVIKFVIFVYIFISYYDSNILLYIRYLGYSLISFIIYYIINKKFNYSKNNIIKMFEEIVIFVICFPLSIIICSLIV